jgi:hypothetical protein
VGADITKNANVNSVAAEAVNFFEVGFIVFLSVPGGREQFSAKDS